MNIDEIDTGDTLSLEARFSNLAGVLTNPAAVTLQVTDPNGTITNPIPTSTVVGIWTSPLTPSIAGTWTYVFTGTGTVAGSETGYVIVGGGPRNTLCSPWASVEQMQAVNGIPTTSTTDEYVLEQALFAASDLLWRWSGYRYGGICFDTVRPCAQPTYMDAQRSWDRPLGSGGWGWWIPSWGSCACQANVHRGCGCQLLSEVELGRMPVRGIVQVRQDGLVLPSTAYRLDDYGWLVRIDGSRFPCCQDFTKNDKTDVNTWAVDFIWGQNPPPSGVQAAVDLAVEFTKAMSGDDCQIPENVASRIRQGETMVFLPPQQYGRDALGHIRAGIRSVDFFLTAVGTSRPAMVHTVDWDATVRRTATDTRR